MHTIGPTTVEQLEAAKLRKKYTPTEVSPLEKAKQLDRLVTAKARTAAIVLGCLGMTVLATGISCILAWHAKLIPYGIAVACIGALLCCFAPKAHHMVKKTESQKVAPEILALIKDI